jgi:RND family efflux transporter MFP subunit
MADELKAESLDLSSLHIHRDEKPPRRGRTGLAIAVAAVLLGGAAVAFVVFRGATRVPVVQADLVRRVGSGASSGAILSAGGYILPDRRAEVSSKVYGRLEWIGVDVGSIVTRDQVIARLANADQAARVEEAVAAVADAEREFARSKKVVEDGVEPRERLDKAETTLKTARARLKAAEAEFEYTLIRAPFDGVVVKRNAQAGETVGPAGSAGTGTTGGSVCVVIDRASLEMVADVNETNIAKVRVGQKVEVAADARPERKYRGEVRLIVPTADRQKGIVQVRVKLLDLDEDVLPEMAARAVFLREGAAEPGKQRLIAPRGSVRERGGGKIVFVVEGDRVRAAAVEAGADGEDGVEILKGLSGGELVVIGGDPVEDGQKVKVAEKK